MSGSRLRVPAGTDPAQRPRRSAALQSLYFHALTGFPSKCVFRGITEPLFMSNSAIPRRFAAQSSKLKAHSSQLKAHSSPAFSPLTLAFGRLADYANRWFGSFGTVGGLSCRQVLGNVVKRY